MRETTPYISKIVALTINGWPKLTSKSYMKSEIHIRQISPLWVYSKIFLFHQLLTVLRTTHPGVKLSTWMWEWYFYCDDAKTSVTLLTHSCFPCGQVASMAAKQVQSSHKGRKRHHLGSASPYSQNFTQSDEFYVPFKSNKNWKQNFALFAFHNHTL